MKLNWQLGRQNSGYFKLKLFEMSWPIGIDLYLLKFEDGVDVPVHRDKVENKKHFRFNVTLKNPDSGGYFYCEKFIFKFSRFVLFRPDTNYHGLTTVNGKLIMVSLGVALQEAK